MSFKNTFKTTAVAGFIAASAATGAFAASDVLMQAEPYDGNNLVEFDLVRTSEAGTIYIYESNAGELGEVLGSAEVSAGANTNVNITLDPSIAQELVAAFVPTGSDTPTVTEDLTGM